MSKVFKRELLNSLKQRKHGKDDMKRNIKKDRIHFLSFFIFLETNLHNDKKIIINIFLLFI